MPRKGNNRAHRKALGGRPMIEPVLDPLIAAFLPPIAAHTLQISICAMVDPATTVSPTMAVVMKALVVGANRTGGGPLDLWPDPIPKKKSD